MCAAAGLATINYLQQHKLAANAAAVGDYLMDELLALKDMYPLIGNVAGKGLHIGIDLVKNRTTKERANKEAEAIMYFCMNEGIAFKLIEGNIITIRPALTITNNHCDMIVTALRKALENL